MTLRSKQLFCLLAVVLLSGCMTPAKYRQRLEQLQPGMSKDRSLEILGGRPVLSDFNWVPEVEVWRYRLCANDGECIHEGVVFVNGVYAGPAQRIPALIRHGRLKPGLAVPEWAVYGAVPDYIQVAERENKKFEFWVYDYVDSQSRKMQLIVFFENGEVSDWVDAPPQEFKSRRGRPGGDDFLVLFGLLSLIE